MAKVENFMINVPMVKFLKDFPGKNAESKFSKIRLREKRTDSRVKNKKVEDCIHASPRHNWLCKLWLIVKGT